VNSQRLFSRHVRLELGQKGVGGRRFTEQKLGVRVAKNVARHAVKIAACKKNSFV
jgi:hypothetical protein